MLLLPRTELHISARLWVDLTETLHAKTEGVHESGAFLLGTIAGRRREVREIVYYDDLDPHVYDSGVVVLRAASFGPLWAKCRQTRLQVVADVHLHGGGADQSQADREHPMIAMSRHLAIILPGFARPPLDGHRIGLYEYRGRHRWRSLGHRKISRHLKIGY
jgi:hypothetical protein